VSLLSSALLLNALHLAAPTWAVTAANSFVYVGL